MGMSGSSRGMQSEMNVTPMIDILLVLLIIFMMIPAPKGLEAIVPQDSPDAQKTQEENVVVIQLSPGAESDAPPSVKLNQQPLTWKEFPDALAKLYVKRTNKSAFLKADGELDFQQVASVIDIAHNSGVVYVGLMTKLPER